MSDICLTALRKIAEGNLGNEPWQANYEKIRKVAQKAIDDYSQSPAAQKQAKAVDRVCHPEQLQVWATDLAAQLDFDGFLRDDFDFDDTVYLHRVLKREIKKIVTSAFEHLELEVV